MPAIETRSADPRQSQVIQALLFFSYLPEQVGQIQSETLARCSGISSFAKAALDEAHSRSAVVRRIRSHAFESASAIGHPAIAERSELERVEQAVVELG